MDPDGDGFLYINQIDSKLKWFHCLFWEEAFISFSQEALCVWYLILSQFFTLMLAKRLFVLQTHDNVVKLVLLEKSEGRHEKKEYSYAQLCDLQSKLMLVAGKAEQGNEEVERFVQVWYKN